ncbi:hypothetical protein EON63_01200 [archaeon]|nr:MAG: hypothetical protein EON63_01200 [archaeon]
MVTFHNQRDFIFVRHHRYIYRKEKDQVKVKSSMLPSPCLIASLLNITIPIPISMSISISIILTASQAKLQELGPRFTLKMKYLLDGCMDTQFGDYEYVHKGGVKGASSKKSFVL